MDSIKKTARTAGLLYVVLAVIFPFSLIYVPSTLFVFGDATATAEHIKASELLFRAGIASGLIANVVYVLLVLALYRLLNEVSRKQAVLMVILVVIAVSVAFGNTFNQIAALVVLSGADFLSVFDKPQLDALAYLFLRLHSHALQAIQIFWGLWLFPFGVLVYKSRFIPKVLGVLLIVAGSAYLAGSLVSILLPQFSDTISPLISILIYGEVPIIFWLLFLGFKPEPTETRP